MKQLPLDFSNSSSQRIRKVNKIEHKIKKTLPTLFDDPPKIDVHFIDRDYSVVIISSSTPQIIMSWLRNFINYMEILKPKEVKIKNTELHKLLYLLPPAVVSLDPIANSLARMIVAEKLNLNPIVVYKSKTRLQGRSDRWPKGSQLKDIPWDAILAGIRLGINVKVEENATKLYLKKIGASSNKLAVARLAGSVISISATNPTLFEKLEIKGLSYHGGKDTGEYKLPLLLGTQLQNKPGVELSSEVNDAINFANRRVMSPSLPENYPWKLHPFQSKDAGKGIRILETTGGVLLAGEMGSGKTIISLTLMEVLNIYPALIVAPLSAFSTWEKHLLEAKRSYYLANKSMASAWYDIKEKDFDVVVVSYDRLPNMIELIEQKKFKTILADEIQRIRTYTARRSKTLRQLASTVPYRIGLSGTPLTNSAKDLLPVGSFLSPNEWRARSNDKELRDLYPEDSLINVSEHLNSMMVRRRIDETGAKLPNRNTHRVYVDLTLDQMRAIEDLESEVREAKKNGEFDDPKSRIHAFARLMRLRQIINNPHYASVGGVNPKIIAAIDLAKDFIALDRKGVIFCADRATFRDLERVLTEEGIGYVGIWGATPSDQRIVNEKRFHNEAEIKVVLCTIQAGSESWSASPTATWLISTAYMYAPAILDQMEARVYRMNSDINGPDIEVSYIHAKSTSPTLDDRMVEILALKKELFAQIVDKRAHIDQTKVHYSMSDLMFLITGEKDDNYLKIEQDAKRAVKAQVKKKENIKNNLYKNVKKENFHQDKIDKLLYDENQDAL